MSGLRLVVVVVCSFISLVECQNSTPPATPCNSHTACDTCVGSTKCLWCFTESESESEFTNNTCTDYPVGSLLPPASVCKLSDASWVVCWVNFEALLIAGGVVGAIILIIILVCLCSCCCCNKFSYGQGADDRQRLVPGPPQNQNQNQVNFNITAGPQGLTTDNLFTSQVPPTAPPPPYSK